MLKKLPPRFHLNTRQIGKTLQIGLILGFAQFFVVKIVTSLAFTNHAAPLSPSSGILVAAMLIFGYGLAPFFWFADLFANYCFVSRDPAYLTIAPLIDTLGAIATVYLLRRFAAWQALQTKTTTVLKFLGITAVVPFLTAAIGSVAICLMLKQWSGFQESWLTEFVSNSLGILIMTPLLLVWRCASSPLKRINRVQLLELVGVLGLSIVIAKISFFGGYRIEHGLMPLVIWSAFRFDPRLSSSLIALLSALAILGTSQGFGAYARLSITESVFLLQSFIGAIALTHLFLVAFVQEHQAVLRQLKQVSQEFVPALAVPEPDAPGLPMPEPAVLESVIPEPLSASSDVLEQQVA